MDLVVSATFACGHPRSEANTGLWRDRSKASGYKEGCRRCSRRATHRLRVSDEGRAKQRQLWAEGKRSFTMSPDDSRHGTIHGYNGGGCRCADCTEAIRNYHRLRRLRAKAKKLGIKLAPEHNQVHGVISLNAVAEARFGMDRVRNRDWDEWADPTGDEAVGL